VYPATNIGLSSPPEPLAMVRDDMLRWGDNVWVSHGNAFQTVMIGGARVGLDPKFLLAKARQVIEKRSPPNLWITAGGGALETCSGVPGLINEMMLQTDRGVTRVFPVFPADQAASFRRLRTFGAFVVSSEIDRGKIGYVEIESEKGRPCQLVNPWPGRDVRVQRDGKPAETVRGELLELQTRPGETLRLAPA